MLVRPIAILCVLIVNLDILFLQEFVLSRVVLMVLFSMILLILASVLLGLIRKQRLVRFVLMLIVLIALYRSAGHAMRNTIQWEAVVNLVL